MEIIKVMDNKEKFMDLLLLGDEQESMVKKYLYRGELFALFDDDLKTVSVVTQDNGEIYEIKNIATYEYQVKDSNNVIEKITSIDNCPTCLQGVDTDHKSHISKQNKDKIEIAKKQIEELTTGGEVTPKPKPKSGEGIITMLVKTRTLESDNLVSEGNMTTSVATRRQKQYDTPDTINSRIAEAGSGAAALGARMESEAGGSWKSRALRDVRDRALVHARSESKLRISSPKGSRRTGPASWERTRVKDFFLL